MDYSNGDSATPFLYKNCPIKIHAIGQMALILDPIFFVVYPTAIATSIDPISCLGGRYHRSKSYNHGLNL